MGWLSMWHVQFCRISLRSMTSSLRWWMCAMVVHMRSTRTLSSFSSSSTSTAMCGENRKKADPRDLHQARHRSTTDTQVSDIKIIQFQNSKAKKSNSRKISLKLKEFFAPKLKNWDIFWVTLGKYSIFSPKLAFLNEKTIQGFF